MTLLLLSNMKFSLRIVAALIAVVVLLILLWMKGQYIFASSPKDKIHINKLWQNNFDSNKGLRDKKLYESQHIDNNKDDVDKQIYYMNNNTCSLLSKADGVSTDLNTHTILHLLDKHYHSKWLENPTNYLKQHFSFKKKAEIILEERFILEEKSSLEKKSATLHVIVVPNSHSDPGWLNTLDGYFQVQTRATLNNMVEKLLKYRNMTFIWPESVFLSMWWNGLDNEMKVNVKELIKRNQLEIVVGSWVVPDEATTHYFGLIDQMIEGHQWLEQNIGVKPENSISLDPFGYSPTLAYLYKRAGFKHMVILRIHQFLKEYFQNRQTMEFWWRQHWDSNSNTDMFTTLLPYMLYNIKHQCGPDHFECLHFDFRKIPGEYSESVAVNVTNETVHSLAKRLLTQYTKKNQLYNHNVVLVPLGDDFRYDRNIEWDQQYENYQKLFNYMNENWKVNARFGTLRDYFDQVEKQMLKDKSLTFPSLKGDFFPYTDRNEDYWTGYFTTRAFDKNFERELEQNLRAAEVFNVLAKASSSSSGKYLYYKSNLLLLKTARESLALFQHHDGITGTARNYVVADYEQRMQKGLDSTKKVLEKSVSFLLAANRDQTSYLQLDAAQPKSLYLLNPSLKVIDFSEEKSNVIILGNPTTQHREDVVRVTVNHDFLEVYDENGHIVISQINPLWDSENIISARSFQLVFLAHIPPLTLVKYTVKFIDKDKKPEENLAAFVSFSNYKVPVDVPKSSRFVTIAPRGESHKLENDYLKARFSARTGYLKSVSSKTQLITKQVNIEMLTYKSRRSGAYIFAPTGPAVDNEMYNLPPVMVIKGPVVSEIHTFQREKVCEHIVSLYNSSGLLGTVLEINNIADMRLKSDKELIMKFTTDMANTESVFFSDLNGLHSMKRRRFRNFPLEANYYPMTSFAYIETEEMRMSVLSAQSLGVSSIENGSLEIMIDRKLLRDDGRGLGEGVMDSKRTPSQFYLLFEKKVKKIIPKIKDIKNRLSKMYYYVANNQTNEMKYSDDIHSYPSLHTFLLLQQLQYHIVILHDISTNTNQLSAQFSPLSSEAFPCDTQLVNLRGLLTDRNLANNDGDKINNKVNAALILHKVGYDCSMPVIGHKCPSYAGTRDITPSKIFRDIQIDSVHNMSLSLMHDYGKLEQNSPLSLKSMEIYNFKISFVNGEK